MLMRWKCPALVCLLTLAFCSAVSADDRPNIILLLTDDQRWDTLGATGNRIIQTPHLDQLAREGITFDNSFVTTSICAISRACLLSGQYARRHGIVDFGTMFEPAAFANTFPQLLRRAGYRIGFIGKWGVGNDLPQKSYDFWDGFPGQGRYYEPGSGEHLTNRQGDSALRFLESCSPGQPFCLQVSFKAAHCQDSDPWQFQYDRRLAALYANADIPVPPTATAEHFARLPSFLRDSEARLRWNVRFANSEMFQNTVKDYYRLITGVDQVVGKMLEKLREKRLDDNTIIVFTSDNGFYLGDHGLAGKWFMHEPSIRVPLIVWDPRQAEDQRGRREARMVLNIDLAPTLLELAGVAIPAEMQGASILPLLENRSVNWRSDFLYEHHFQHRGIPVNEGVRGERWKYSRYRWNDRWHEQLFDLQQDRHEEHNLSDNAAHAGVLVTLRARCDQLCALAAQEGEPAQPLNEAVSAAAPAEDATEERQADEEKLVYPKTRRSDQVDVYHGTEIADPYRWLEDVDSPETKEWVEAQNKVTFAYLEKIPERISIERRLTELWNFERFGLPRKRGGKYFYTRNDGLQNQSVLYVADSLDAEPRMLLDPNTLSADGTVALAEWQPSDDGKYLAYALASAGSDWREIHVLEVDTGTKRPDVVKWVKFSGISWTPDHQGFYYSRYDEPKTEEQFTATNYFQKLYYHRLGEPQEQDKLVYERPDYKDWGFDGHVTDDGRYLVISVWRGTESKSQIFYQDLQSPSSPVVELIAGFDAEYLFIGNQDDVFFIATDRDAPMRRVMAVDLNQPDAQQWKEIIPEASEVLQGANLIGGRLVAKYLKDAHSVVKIFNLDGSLDHEVEFPGLGSVSGFNGRSDDPETFYDFSNFTTPSRIMRYNVQSGDSSVFREPELKFNPGEYETRQVFYQSKDGTRVPMFITHRRGLELNGNQPTLLYGYGGFDIAMTPSFSVMNLVWMEMGGVYAMANMRGGGEYGRAWHEGGMLQHKQNVFDDFIAAAEWLIDNNYTRPEKLGIHGRSNGGLLIGAVMTQRPELFGATIPTVGVMDMLRYHEFTIGWAWVNEYGSSEDAEQFRNLLKYSPLHNLKPGVEYPPTLVTTADHDDRVVPGHSFKFAAALQHAHKGDNPVLIRIETSAGHGAGTPTSKLIQTYADMLAFLVHELDM